MSKSKTAEISRPAAALSPARRGSVRLLLLLADILLLLAAYVVARDVIYGRILNRFAQGVLNRISSTSVERIGRVDFTWEGNLVLHRAEVSASRLDRRRLFYRAERIEIAFDGNPVVEEGVRLMRVDLIRPEIFVVRDRDADWNVLWALHRAPETADSAPPRGAAPGPEGSPLLRDPFPRNGIHIHDGVVHVIFVAQDGAETEWVVTRVHGVFTRGRGGSIRFGPLTGEFYGGRIRADSVLRSIDPFAMDMTVNVRGAEVAQMIGHFPRITRPMTGRFDMVLSATSDLARTNQARPVAAGQASIQGGKLWELPAFVSVLALFALTESGDNVLDRANIEFTLEKDRVRIDRMDFLGTPLSLFGSGTMAVDGRDLDVTLVPRLGCDLGDIIPLGGTVLQALLDLAKGAIMPVRIGGTFWHPRVNFAPDAPVSDPVRELIEETPLPK